MWDISVGMCVVGAVILYVGLGGSWGGLFNTWRDRFGDERVKQALIVGLLLVALGTVGIVFQVWAGCTAHPQGCLAS
jgi:uncharacterized membrane protein